MTLEQLRQITTYLLNKYHANTPIEEAVRSEIDVLTREVDMLTQLLGIGPPPTDEVDPSSIDGLTIQMRRDSEHWFPGLHSGETSSCPLLLAYTLGLAGEAGEVANVVKKLNRDGLSVDRFNGLADELADALTYLLLLADEAGISIVEAYRSKRRRNIERWGDPDQQQVRP